MLPWLRSRFDQGMAVSQAVALWRQQDAEVMTPIAPARCFHEEPAVDLGIASRALLAALLDFEEMGRLSPAVVLMSATTVESVPGLIQMGKAIRAIKSPRPVFGYDGNIFSTRPELRDQAPGVFLGDNARLALNQVAQVLAEHPRWSGPRAVFAVAT